MVFNLRFEIVHAILSMLTLRLFMNPFFSQRGNGGRSPSNHPGMINASPTMKNHLSGSLEVAPRSRWDVSLS